MGLAGVPPFNLGAERCTLAGKRDYYYLMVVLAGATLWLTARLLALARGARARAPMRENESLAESSGISAYRHTMLAMVVVVPAGRRGRRLLRALHHLSLARALRLPEHRHHGRHGRGGRAGHGARPRGGRARLHLRARAAADGGLLPHAALRRHPAPRGHVHAAGASCSTSAGSSLRARPPPAEPGDRQRRRSRRARPRAAPGPALAVRDVTVRFGGLAAVEGLSLDLGRGEILALIGPNGAGKSTAFNVDHGLPAAGRGARASSTARTSPAGRPTASPSAASCACSSARASSRKPPALDNVLTACHRLARTGLGERAPHDAAHIGWRSAPRRARAGPPRLRGARPQGETSRRATSRAGSSGSWDSPSRWRPAPSVLLLDEPAAGLNAVETERLMRLIEEIRGARACPCCSSSTT